MLSDFAAISAKISSDFEMILKIFLLTFLLKVASTQFLSVAGRQFMFGGQHVHLSGANIAWRSYGFDFGNGQYATNGPELENWIREIAGAGGNSLSAWLHPNVSLWPLINFNYQGSGSMWKETTPPNSTQMVS